MIPSAQVAFLTFLANSPLIAGTLTLNTGVSILFHLGIQGLGWADRVLANVNLWYLSYRLAAHSAVGLITTILLLLSIGFFFRNSISAAELSAPGTSVPRGSSAMV